MATSQNVSFSLFPSTFLPVCRLLSPFCKACSFFVGLRPLPPRAVLFQQETASFVIFSNISEDIFSFRIKFVLLHLHLPLAAGMSSEGDGATGRSTTYWKALGPKHVFAGDVQVIHVAKGDQQF